MIKLFTHTDLDGVGCAILLNHYKDTNKDYDIVFCEPRNINEKISEMLSDIDKSRYKVEKVYITDLSLNKDVANELNQYATDYGLEVHLFDHHQTALWMNDEYEWATVEVGYTNSVGDQILSSGTSLFYKYLSHLVTSTHNNRLSVSQFVDYVRLHDTYQWKDYGEIGEFAEDLNYLFRNMDRDIFIKEMNDYYLRLATFPNVFKPEHSIIIARALIDRDNAYNKAARIMKKYIYRDNIKYGLYYGHEYTSETCRKLLLENPDISFVCCINMENKSVSLRSIEKDNPDDEIDVSAIAAIHNGGGHKYAAGFTIDENTIDSFVFNIMSKIKLIKIQ